MSGFYPEQNPFGNPQFAGGQYGGSKYYQPSQDDRTWGMLAHLSPIVLGFIGPLIIWLIYKGKSPFVEDQAKEALNLQLCLLIVTLILVATCVGIIIAPVIGIGALVYSIIAGMEANKGIWYRYPHIFRLIN